MFCSQCGAEIADKAAKYCSKCGFQLNPSSKSKSVGFLEFKRIKEEERRAKFAPKETNAKKSKVLKPVTINIGFMKYINGCLKKCRGKTLPVIITPHANAEEIKQKAILKHSNHDRSIHDGFEYVLLYPDGSEIVYLPGTNDAFILEKYREELGRPYNRITLFLCVKTDFMFSEMPVIDLRKELDGLDASDDEDLMKSVFDGDQTQDHSCSVHKTEFNTSCSICLEEIALDEIAAKPDSCDDVFHEVCLKEWLITCDSVAKCPICKNVFTSSVSTPTASHKMSSPAQSQVAFTSTVSTPSGSSTEMKSTTHCQDSQSSSTSSTLDYMYVNRQYGDILYVSDDSDGEESHESTSIPEETETSIKTTFTEDLAQLCESKAHELEENSYIRFKVRRNSLWQDVKFKCDRIMKKDIEENSYVKVQFVGEAGVDQGGPKREFFSLIHKEVSSSSLFVGEEVCGKIFAHNLVALQQNEYFKYGLCCGLAVLNGSVGPQFFCPPVVDYLLHGDVNDVKCSIDSIPDKPVKEKLKELNSIEEQQLFEEKVMSYFGESLHNMGYTKPVVFSDKTEFLRAATIHYTVSHCLWEMNQFIDGLKVTGVLQVLRNHPLEAREVLQFSTCTLTAELLDGLFSAHLSPEGSNKNAKEKTILFYWNQFLEDVEQGLVKSEVYDYNTESNVTVNISLEAVLTFITGSRSIPPLGLHPRPSIVFIHEGNRKMYVSTCSNVLYIPVTDHFLSFGTFKEEFIFCMLNSPGFGNV